MTNQNTSTDIFLENQSLKFEFSLRNLDLTDVLWAEPDNLERENLRLRSLLEWVKKYNELGNRQAMEAMGYDFPPIYPGISPNNDWDRFERWMEGRPLRLKLMNQLPPYYTPPKPELLTDDEIILELETLCNHLIEIRVSADFGQDMPPRLAYTYLFECLDDEFDIITEGFLHLDGCGGYCPGCVQRPWCESGCRSCWPEDEEIGKMCLVDLTKDYVSASPISLQLLQKFQAEEDKEMEEFEKNYKGKGIPLAPFPFDIDDFDFDDKDGIPF